MEYDSRLLGKERKRKDKMNTPILRVLCIMLHKFLTSCLDHKEMWHVVGNIIYLEASILLGEKVSLIANFLVKLESVVSFTV
jgi:hypothetical protein